MPELIGFSELCWDDRGLLPAVVQDVSTGAVLMVAWMSEQALRVTLETGETHFWSRSRGELWHKGETSGNRQRVAGVFADCDGDTLLVLAEPLGPACHTGADSCFFRALSEISQPQRWRPVGLTDSVQLLWSTIEARKQNPPPGSYTAELFTAGVPRIARKVGEEAVETAIAALSEGDDRLLSEMADLVYHCLVLLSAKSLSWDDLQAELARRFK